MKLEIVQDGVTTEVDLRDGTFTLGGGETDAVRVPGLAPALLAASIEGDQVIVEAAEALEYDGASSPARLRRLWLPGETIQASPAVQLRRAALPPSDSPVGTVAVLRELIDPSAAAAVQDGPSLTCLTGLDLGRVFPLADGETVIGRGSAVTLRIRDRSVSRRHARVALTCAGATVADLGSPNGVFVNGERVDGERVLRPGDLIEIGMALLKYRAPKGREEPAAEDSAAVQKDLPSPTQPRKRRLEWMAWLSAALVTVAGAALTWRLAL